MSRAVGAPRAAWGRYVTIESPGMGMGNADCVRTWRARADWTLRPPCPSLGAARKVGAVRARRGQHRAPLHGHGLEVGAEGNLASSSHPPAPWPRQGPRNAFADAARHGGLGAAAAAAAAADDSGGGWWGASERARLGRQVAKGASSRASASAWTRALGLLSQAADDMSSGAGAGMGLLYRRFFDAFKKKDPTLPALTAAAEATEEWKQARAEYPDQRVFEEHINQRVEQYLLEASSSGGCSRSSRSLGTNKVVFPVIMSTSWTGLNLRIHFAVKNSLAELTSQALFLCKLNS